MKNAILQPILCLVTTLLSLYSWTQNSINPILRNVDEGFLYAADPAAEVYNGKVYVYCSHDQPDATGYSSMQDYMVLESEDMINWVNHGVVLKPREYSWASGQMNAPDVAYKDGWYYFYFPYDKTHVGVAKSRNPEGPWEEAVSDKITTIFDPTVFVDDDGQAYIYGSDNKVNIGDEGRHIYGAKLKDNMTELDSDWVRLTEETVDEAAHIFKRNNIYYLNARVGSVTKYWMSDSPLPKYATLAGELAPNAPGAPNHASAIEFNDQWYFFYQRADVNSGTYHRRSAGFEKMYFNDDGTIQPIIYSLDPSYINKEDIVPDYIYYPGDTLYFKNVDNLFPADGSGVKVESAGNIGFTKNQNYVEFDSINIPTPAQYLLTLNVSHKVPSSYNTGILQVFANDTKIGSLEINGTGNWNDFVDYTGTLTTTESLKNATLKFLFDVNDDQLYLGNFLSAKYELIPGTETNLSNKTFNLSSIQVTPTLVSEILNISNIEENTITYKIYNLEGKLSHQGVLLKDHSEINVAFLKNGVYLIKLMSNDNSLVKKFVKI